MDTGKEKEIVAGILRVEAQNDRTNWVKQHKPNLGPYTAENPKYCLDCGKPGSKWVEREHCVPK